MDTPAHESDPQAKPAATASTQHSPAPHTDSAQTSHMSKQTLLAALAYIGPLVVISYTLMEGDEFVKFHVKQGAVLFVIEMLLWILTQFMIPLMMLWGLIHLGAIILSIFGIINAAQHKKTELPLVGSFSKHIPI